jgi:Subtilase family
MFSNSLIILKKYSKSLLCCIIFLNSFTFIHAQKNIFVNKDSSYIKKYAASFNSNTVQAFQYIISFANEIPKQFTPLRTLTKHTAIFDANTFAKIKEANIAAEINIAKNTWKYSPALEKQLQSKKVTEKKLYTITVIDYNIFIAQTKPFAKEKIEIIQYHEAAKSAIIKCTKQFLIDYIEPLTTVTFIDEYILPQTEVAIIGYKRNLNGINQLDYSIPNANGKNIVVGVKEQKMEVTDIDLYKRVISSSIESTITESHATTIATIIGGAGNTFYDGRGIAHACNFFSSSFSNLFADDLAILNQKKVTVQNHSYGTVIQQFYGAEAVSYDAQTWSNKNLVHVFSSGNRGQLSATDGQYANLANFANLTGNFKMAKNIITVGAIDELGNIAAASSAGPLFDGRIAPQITALGPNGTSDAAAIVSGTIATMQQVYVDSNSQALPPAALIKAILYNTATDIYKTGIDYKTGYGLVNCYEAVKAIQQKKYEISTLSQNQVWTKNITVPTNAATVKLTLSWTDNVATVNNNKALLNDVDVELIETTTGTIYKPWVLSTVANIDSLNAKATRKRDSLNTTEQISIARPNAGNYQIKVVGTNIINAPLAFALAYKIDTLNTFGFTNPQHTSDVNIQEDENLRVQWKTFVADTNQLGNLFISYNGGANWLLLQSNLKIYTQQYIWPVKDTNSIANFKMETSFGSFISKPFILSRVIRPNIDFLCTDSFQLSWNKHVYATSYKIFALTDSTYLKPIFTTTDTAIGINRTTFPYIVYAVEPILSNLVPASRSVGFNIEEQGVNCFYKTFNYEVLDNSVVKLIVELSITSNVDSVFFEQVSTNGQLLKTYGPVKIINGTYIYSNLINDVETGVHFFRARIKLKNGKSVYTDVLSILTTGEKFLYLYPNPIKSGAKINFLLKGQVEKYNLQLYTASGVFIKNWEIQFAGTIKLPILQTGYYYYRLTDEENRKIESGKILIN